MLAGKTIGVIMPAFNEEPLIGRTLATVPELVDQIIVINDGSTDGTLAVVQERQRVDPRVHIVQHECNRGLGQSLIDGYLAARRLALDVVATMDGDGQMAPDDLARVLQPVVAGVADYCKGNRLLHRDVTANMPTYRLVGNALLTFLSKFATGYWQLMDPQCAYAAISRRALAAIPIERMTKGYGYNADILNMLNIYNFRVAMVEVQPLYGLERSKIKLRKYIPRVSLLLVRLFLRRLIRKYLVRNFNPLCLSYICGLLLLVCGSLPLGIMLLVLYSWYWRDPTMGFPRTTLMCLMFTTIAGLQIVLSAIQYDMEDNRHLFLSVLDGNADAPQVHTADAGQVPVPAAAEAPADARHTAGRMSPSKAAQRP